MNRRDLLAEYELAMFFKGLRDQTYCDYEAGLISARSRDELLYEIRTARNATMLENDAMIKKNPALREMAGRLLQLRQRQDVRDSQACST